MKTTESIDKLYLELSQFTSAKTAKELRLLKWLKIALRHVPRNGERITIEGIIEEYEGIKNPPL